MAAFLCHRCQYIASCFGLDKHLEYGFVKDVTVGHCAASELTRMLAIIVSIPNVKIARLV